MPVNYRTGHGRYTFHGAWVIAFPVRPRVWIMIARSIRNRG